MFRTLVPVRISNLGRCRRQVTRYPSIRPLPRSEPMWEHFPSMAYNSPSILAMSRHLSPTLTPVIPPSGHSEDPPKLPLS
jgi:hypothetical protein